MKAVSYGRLEKQDKRWVLSGIPPHVAIRLKDVFRNIPKTQTKVFDLALTDENSADLEWFLHRYPMTMSAEDRALLSFKKQNYDRTKEEIDAIFLPDWQAPALFGFKPGYQPYPIQRQAVEMLIKMDRLLLGDDVGFGKTWVALAALVGSPERLPAAIVVQAHLADQWVDEFITPFTYMKAHIIDGTRPYNLPPANLYIFRYSNIHGWSDIAATGFFKTVVFDEIQELRRGTATRKGKAAKVFADNARVKLGLSATPVFNYGDEIFNILEFLDETVLGSWDEFVREWCYRKGTHYLVEDPDALGSYLREAQIFLRRVREGRPINRIPVEIDFDEQIAADSAALARKLAIKVLTGSFVEAGSAARELDAFARLQTGLAKAKSVAAYVKMLIAGDGRQVLLGGWHREVYKVWLDEFRDLKPALYTGTESSKRKNEVKRAFIAREINPLIISLRSGAGLDGLQKVCSTAVIGEFDWSPQVMEQLLGRLDRPLQPEPEVTAIFPWVNFGSDPTIMSVNAIKKDQARGIHDPGTTLPPAYTDESRVKLLAEHFLERVGEPA